MQHGCRKESTLFAAIPLNVLVTFVACSSAEFFEGVAEWSFMTTRWVSIVTGTGSTVPLPLYWPAKG